VIADIYGVAAFVATNLDDILILTILFSQTGKLFRRRRYRASVSISALVCWLLPV
jgi:cadmium resistance protein CadD (predicted permease)